jgi:hypothetical protein
VYVVPRGCGPSSATSSAQRGNVSLPDPALSPGCLHARGGPASTPSCHCASSHRRRRAVVDENDRGTVLGWSEPRALWFVQLQICPIFSVVRLRSRRPCWARTSARPRRSLGGGGSRDAARALPARIRPTHIGQSIEGSGIAPAEPGQELPHLLAFGVGERGLEVCTRLGWREPSFGPRRERPVRPAHESLSSIARRRRMSSRSF